MAPSVSILVPLYNRETHITAAVRSILNQSYQDFELIVWDDGSSDRSAELALAAGGADPRFRLVRAENRGVCVALNAAALLASGQYLGWVDSDDALAPQALAETVAALEARPDLGMVYTQHLIMDEQGTLLGLGKSSTIPFSKERLLVPRLKSNNRQALSTLPV